MKTTVENFDATEKHRKPRTTRGFARAMGSSAPGCRSTSAHKQVSRARSAMGLGTQVTARIDVGFGNSLFIRGEGNGLSWEHGQPLTCVDGAAWVWSAPTAAEESVFKLLLNDQVWCRGENLRVGSGAQLEIAPVF